MAIPPGGTAPAPGAANPASDPPPSVRSRRGVIAVVVAGLALASAVSAAYVVDDLTASPTMSGPDHGPLTFAEARTLSDGAAAAREGGSWSLLAAEGYLSTAPLTVPLGELEKNLTEVLGVLNCTFTPIDTNATLGLPAFTGNASLGVAPDWTFVYGGPDGAILAISVLDGTATPIATLGGGDCSTVTPFVTPVPAEVADSPAVAAAAAAAGGAAFLAAHPGADVSFGLTPEVRLASSLRGEWNVTYSACSPLRPSGTAEPVLTVALNRTDGHVLATTTASVNCSTSILDAPDLAAGLASPASPLSSPASPFVAARGGG